jgi:hypothetical protein
MKSENHFWQKLKENRPNLTKQQYNTLKGQAKSGNVDAAMRGLKTLLDRRDGK